MTQGEQPAQLYERSILFLVVCGLDAVIQIRQPTLDGCESETVQPTCYENSAHDAHDE